MEPTTTELRNHANLIPRERTAELAVAAAVGKTRCRPRPPAPAARVIGVGVALPLAGSRGVASATQDGCGHADDACDAQCHDDDLHDHHARYLPQRHAS